MWFKVDDALAFHPKVIAAGNSAMGLWVRAGSYCGSHLTDGRLPRAMLKPLGGRSRDAERLVSVGLWDATDEGWEFRDWTDFQPSRSQVEAERAATAERVRKHRAAKSAKGSEPQRGHSEAKPEPNLSHSEATDEPSGGPHSVPPIGFFPGETMNSNAVTNTVGTPAPTRPDPTRSKETPTESLEAPAAAVALKRGSRIPEDFTITDDMRTWAKDNLPGLNVDSLLGEFVDYWRGVAGSKGVKLDWVATWRNGMRKRWEWLQERGGGTGAGMRKRSIEDLMNR